jgi:hypothetical protein
MQHIAETLWKVYNLFLMMHSLSYTSKGKYADLLFKNAWRLGMILCETYISDGGPLTGKLPENCGRNGRRFISTLKQINRLSNNERLLGTGASRERFLRRKEKLTKSLTKLLRSLHLLEDWELYLRKFHPRREMPSRAKNIDGIWYRVPNPGMAFPNLHPHAHSDMPQWNKWFENFDTSGFTIHQRLPLSAMTIVDRLRYMTSVVETTYRTVSSQSQEMPHNFINKYLKDNRILDKRVINFLSSIGMKLSLTDLESESAQASIVSCHRRRLW